MRNKFLKLIAVMAFAAIGTQAHANLTSFLTLSDPSASLGSGPYAEIQISQGIDANTVNVTETFLTPYYGVFTGGPHGILGWNISGSETITISNLLESGSTPAGWALTGPQDMTPFGTFEYGLDCSSCKNGGPGSYSGPITFSIISSSALDPTKFVANTDGYLFASDIINTSDGATGDAASVSAVPEPEIYAMLSIGLGFMGWIGRRRKPHAA